MTVNEILPSAGPAPTALSEGGPGHCARRASEQGQFSQLHLLERSAETAVTMLEKIAADTVAGEADPQDDGGLKYARVSKALRMTLVLHAKFEEDSLKSDQERAAQAAARQAAEAQRAASALTAHKRYQKHTVERAVEQAIVAEAVENDDEDERDYGELYSDLYERLNDFEDYSDFGRKSVGEIVEQICRLLNLPFDPALWQDEPWAIAEAKAKPPGSPFADRPDTANDDDADDEDDEPRTARGTGPP